jgi:hypothetical protein
MPTETVIIVAGIVLVFAVFGVTLAWAGYYTRNVRTSGATYFRDQESKAPDRISARPSRGGLSVSPTQISSVGT